MKYWPGVPTCAPNGLRTHICHVPSAAATAKAAKAIHKCARQRRSAFRTDRPPNRVGFKIVLRNYLDDSVHLAVPQPAILVTRHKEIAGSRKYGIYLCHVSGDDHSIYIGPGNQNAMNNVRARHPERYLPSFGNLNATGDKHELRGDNTCSDAAVAGYCGP